jgi:hypothetical protein
VQGTADLTQITVNGVKQVAFDKKALCKKGGWKHFPGKTFKNQGQCIKFLNHQKHESEHSSHKH